MQISEKDKQILRTLATKQKSFAQSDRNKQTKEEWYRHHRFEKGRPMIHIELYTFQEELLLPLLQCEGKLARQLELDLYQQFYNYEWFEDDKVVPDFFPIQWKTWFNLFDIVVGVTNAESESGSSLGHHFNHVFTTLDEALPMLKPSTYGVDREKTLDYYNQAKDIFGDILKPKIIGSCLAAVPTQQLVHFMGMENMFMAMYDTPDLFKNIMNRIAEEYIQYYRFLEKENLLLPTTEYEHLGQGSFSFNQTLPNAKEHYTSSDIWGFMDSQETVGISPEMYGEFIFPCYEKIAKEFGCLSYGCCEPVHAIWDAYVSKLHHISKVSISPWCDETFMGERLKNTSIIYHRKPTPNFLGVDVQLNENKVREYIRATFTAAKDCQIEITQRDVYTVHKNPEKVKRYVQIIREEWENSH